MVDSRVLDLAVARSPRCVCKPIPPEGSHMGGIHLNPACPAHSYLLPDGRTLLGEVADKSDALEQARAEYQYAVLTASDSGYSNVAIAVAAAKSEAAIRMYLKRKRA